MDERLRADPDACHAGGGHYWHDSLFVIDTAPETYTQYCARCPAFRERGGWATDPEVWSEPKVHERFRRT